MQDVTTIGIYNMNTIGTLYRLTSFGESHGPGIGGVIDGFPSGIDIDMDLRHA